MDRCDLAAGHAGSNNECCQDDFVVSGDILPKKTVEGFFKMFESMGKNTPKITNLYGPTECCVDSTFYEVSHDNIDLYETIPIGKPMPNEQVYIVDRLMLIYLG